MKKKTITVIISAVSALVLIGVLLIIAFTGAKVQETPSSEPDTTSSDLTVFEILTDDENTSAANGSETADNETGEYESVPDLIIDDPTDEPDQGDVLTIPDETFPALQEETVTNEPAKTPVKPIDEKTPTDDGDGDTSGVVIVGGNQPEPYDCGTPGHHCDGPETHAYVLNLEKEGCPYCGKHDCPSFYAVDEWGNTCYTPSKCPKYDVHKDPVYYCQICGKRCGDGSNGTCVQFVSACNCPNCGEWVESWTCHTCK